MRQIHTFYSYIKRLLFISPVFVLVVGFVPQQVHAQGAQCPAGMSQLDCQALTNGWVDWVPITCSVTATTTTTSSTTLGNDNQQKMFNYFTSHGFTPEQAAGMVGNAIVESLGVDPEMSQLDQKDHQYPPQPNNPQLGWGIVQWTPANKILNYATAVSQPPYLITTQLDFLLNQLNGTAPNDNEKTAGDMLKQVTSGIVVNGVQRSTAWHAAQVFLQYYERAADHAPNGPNALLRGQLADQVLAKYGASAQTGTSSTPPGTPTATISGSSSCPSVLITTQYGGTGVPGQCDTPAPTSGYAAIQAVLLSKFKMNLTGSTSVSWATQTYNTICALAKAPAYFSRLTSAGPITLNLTSGNCSGHSSTTGVVNLYGDCGNLDYNRFILTHELGHEFAFRNPSVYKAFDTQVWSHAPTLPTYNCQFDYGIGPFEAECWADMIGEYLVWFDIRDNIGNRPPGTRDFKQYQSQYPAYYNFARDQLFGGVEYTSF